MNSQIVQLLIATVATAAGMLVGLLSMRAGARAYWRWPVYSVMVMVLGVITWNLLRKHVFPAEWVVTQSRAMYFGALAMYVVFGFAMGLLLGRLTRRSRSSQELDINEQPTTQRDRVSRD
ncbi:MAG TPA: hypothetical protein VFP37_17710 [Steroidobacteraceae bacterium]|nr:hypothetical protein [Steroidobacteraceae bacterium]